MVECQRWSVSGRASNPRVVTDSDGDLRFACTVAIAGGSPHAGWCDRLRRAAPVAAVPAYGAVGPVMPAAA